MLWMETLQWFLKMFKYIPSWLFVDLLAKNNWNSCSWMIPKGNCHFGYTWFSGKVVCASKTLVICKVLSRFCSYLIVLNGPKPIWLVVNCWVLYVNIGSLCLLEVSKSYASSLPLSQCQLVCYKNCKSHSKFW